ncbi:unnamed protein product [Adineta steineri]|uniref:Uncharacterized protein n=1 Tax=Adineta steineri TaxID=433720 RepID=A0A816DA88_9BILA|nr:unnamed protein product [Adineta steineri]CAF1633641.1 unnamed protein product [Adineta steineri]
MWIRFDKIRDETISKLNECSNCIKMSEKLYLETIEMNTILESKLVNASNEEKEWKDINVKLATTSMLEVKNTPQALIR